MSLSSWQSVCPSSPGSGGPLHAEQWLPHLLRRPPGEAEVQLPLDNSYLLLTTHLMLEA